MNKISQSLLQLLLNIPGLELHLMPGLKPNIGIKTNDPKAKMLMSMWEDVENKIADKKFKKPATFSSRDITELETAGYVKQHGDNLVITQKGSDLIKIMLLNDDSNSFEKQAEQRVKTASYLCSCNLPQNWYKRKQIS